MLYYKTGEMISRYFNTYDAFIIFKASAVSAFLISIIMFSSKSLGEAPRTLPFIHFAILSSSLLLACYVRGELRVWLQRRRLKSADAAPKRENVLVIGANRCAMVNIRLAAFGGAPARRVLAILDSHPQLRNRSIAGCSVIDNVCAIESIIDEYAVHGVQVHEIFLANDPDNLTKLERAALERAAAKFGCRIVARNSLFDERLDDFEPPSGQIAIKGPLVGSSSRFWAFKRGFDLLSSALVGLALLPIVLPGTCLLFLDVGTGRCPSLAGRGAGGGFKSAPCRSARFDRLGASLRGQSVLDR